MAEQQGNAAQQASAAAQRIVVELQGGSHQIMPADQPLLCADDLAALRGDGIFETLLVRGSYARNIDPHFARLERSARQLALPSPSYEQWVAATNTAIAEFRATIDAEADAAVRWNLSRGRETTGVATAWLSIAAFPASYEADREHGIVVLTGPRGFRRDIGQRAPWALAGAKTLSYAVNMAALRYAKAHGAADMIFLDDDDYVLEGPTSTVLVVQDGRLLTPPPSAGILHGTTQLRLFAKAQAAGWEVAEYDLKKADLFAADGVYLLSSGRLATWVRQLDEQTWEKSRWHAGIQELALAAIQ